MSCNKLGSLTEPGRLRLGLLPTLTEASWWRLWSGMSCHRIRAIREGCGPSWETDSGIRRCSGAVHPNSGLTLKSGLNPTFLQCRNPGRLRSILPFWAAELSVLSFSSSKRILVYQQKGTVCPARPGAYLGPVVILCIFCGSVWPISYCIIKVRIYFTPVVWQFWLHLCEFDEDQIIKIPNT